MTRTNIIFDEDLKERLERQAKAEKLSLSALIRKISDSYLKNKTKKNPFDSVKKIKNIKISQELDGNDLSEEIDNLIYG